MANENVNLCKICGKGTKCVAKHVVHSHKVFTKDYYDKYLKKEGSGKCLICNKNTRFKSLTSGYCKYCSDICSSKDKDKNKKISNTVMSADCQHRTKQTCLEKYGTEYSFQSDNNKKKSTETCLKKYGDIHSSKSDLVKDKTKRTCLKLYGRENPAQVKIFKDKIKKTCLKKFGKSSHLLDTDIQDRIRRFNLKKYGVEFKFQSEDFRYNAMYRGRYKLKSYITKFGDSIKYQTKPELNFIKYCEYNDIKIINGDRIPYVFSGKSRVYFCDFKIVENHRYRLVEIKQKHKWWFDELQSGKMKQKVISAIKYSKNKGYLPYKIYFNF